MSDVRTLAGPASLSGWNAQIDTAVCEYCQWRFLTPAGSGEMQCPHCHQRALSFLPEGLQDMPHPYPPEMVVPFSFSSPALGEAIRHFSRGIPFPPEDLNADKLSQRLQRIYLPMWLVDSSVAATWQAEMGFDYEVISHQEQFDQNRSGWESKEVKEARVRWENRVGRVNRIYHNIAVPALEDAAQIKNDLGAFKLSQAVPYDPQCLEQASVRLPDLSPKEAWSEAAPAFQSAAADECQRACGADHQRQFRWKAQFTNLNWTMLLLPAFTSYYMDDEGKPQVILIHGQTCQISGARKASMQRARNTSLVLLLVGIIVFLIGLILEVFSGASPLLGMLAVLAILGGIGSSLASIIPYASAWDFNRKNQT
jgi:hypothetical protein